MPGEDASPPPVFRGDGVGAEIALEPTGEVQSPPRRFRWRAIPEAHGYRLEIFDDQAQRLRVESTADTVFTIPDGEPPLGAGFWQLTPIDEFGIAGDRSEPFHFTVMD
jgi:hypothetical protein